MPSQADAVKLWVPGKAVQYGTGQLTDPVNYYGPLGFLADGMANPLSLPSLRGWWDYTALGLSNGAAVTTCSDGSGNGFTHTNLLGTPTYITNQQNGLGAVNIDSGRVMGNASFTTTAGSWTVMCIIKKSADSGTHALWSDSATDPFSSWSTTTLLFDPGTTQISSATASGTTTHFIMYTAVAGTTAVYLNSTSSTLVTGTSAAVSAFSGIRLGDIAGAGGTTGDLYEFEVAVWDGILAGGSLTALASYVNNKYALSVT